MMVRSFGELVHRVILRTNDFTLHVDTSSGITFTLADMNPNVEFRALTTNLEEGFAQLEQHRPARTSVITNSSTFSVSARNMADMFKVVESLAQETVFGPSDAKIFMETRYNNSIAATDDIIYGLELAIAETMGFESATVNISAPDHGEVNKTSAPSKKPNFSVEEAYDREFNLHFPGKKVTNENREQFKDRLHKILAVVSFDLDELRQAAIGRSV